MQNRATGYGIPNHGLRERNKKQQRKINNNECTYEIIPMATIILAIIKTQACACLAEHINFNAPLELWIWIYM